MDIHPPHGRVDSLKEFFTHILIVSISILIALGLEGIRESWREHVEIQETRESFRAELSLNLQQLAKDQAQMHQTDTQLDQIIAEMPGLVKSPEALNKRVDELKPGFYFFSTRAWESAMASGVLEHMKREERDHFVNAYLSVKNYRDYSLSTISAYTAVETYFPSHHAYSVADESDGEQKLRTLKMDFQVMEHLGQEMAPDIDVALKSQ